MPATSYARKISSEEEEEGYILVLKDKLSFFPPQGQSFELAKSDLARRVSVESYPCQCRGPELPHEHYFVRWRGLKQGQKVTVSRSSDSAYKYSLRVE